MDKLTFDNSFTFLPFIFFIIGILRLILYKIYSILAKSTFFLIPIAHEWHVAINFLLPSSSICSESFFTTEVLNVWKLRRKFFFKILLDATVNYRKQKLQFSWFLPTGALKTGRNLSNFDLFSKMSSSTFSHLIEKLNAYVDEKTLSQY